MINPSRPSPAFRTASNKSWVWRPGNEATRSILFLAYRGLDHVVSAEPHVADKVEYVNDIFSFHLLQHHIDCDESPCATHTSTGGEMRRRRGGGGGGEEGKEGVEERKRRRWRRRGGEGEEKGRRRGGEGEEEGEEEVEEEVGELVCLSCKQH